MTIDLWILFVIIALVCIGCTIAAYVMCDTTTAKVLATVVCVLIIVFSYIGFHWYCTSTASGIRAMTDQQAELNNGLERTINIYTANGDLIASYSGKIDLEDNEGGYVLFEVDGKRYTYYNCFVESIAEIE